MLNRFSCPLARGGYYLYTILCGPSKKSKAPKCVNALLLRTYICVYFGAWNEFAEKKRKARWNFEKSTALLLLMLLHADAAGSHFCQTKRALPQTRAAFQAMHWFVSLSSTNNYVWQRLQALSAAVVKDACADVGLSAAQEANHVWNFTDCPYTSTNTYYIAYSAKSMWCICQNCRPSKIPMAI